MKNITSRININEVVNETLFEFPSIEFKVKIRERCKDLGITLAELSNLTGVRYATISELNNSKKATLNLQNVLAIMVALRIKSFDEIFELQFNEEDERLFNIDSEYYREKGLPNTKLQQIEDNKIRLGRE